MKPQNVDVVLPQNVEKIMTIRRGPIMEYALDVLTNLSGFGKIVLVARGDDIPIAVGVANVVTEKIMKDHSKIAQITVDSENGKGRYGETLVSTIQITITKNQ